MFRRAISMLPRSQSWNYLLQKHVTKSLDLDTIWFQRRLRECRWHLENCFNTGGNPSTRVLELGTGWHPTIPLAFWLCGVSKIFTIDIQPVLRPETLRATFESFVASADRGELAAALPWLKEDRLAMLRTIIDRQDEPIQILRDLGIEALVRDARDSGLESASIDFFYSNSVLNEIPAHILTNIFSEFKRLASRRAAMSHYILLKDMYSSFDSSITSFNFLKYPDWAWNIFNSPLQCQNRLRVSDYRQIHQSNGFALLYEHDERGSPADLERVRIAKKFRRYSPDELLVTRSWIVSSIDPAPRVENSFSPGWMVTPRSRG